MRIWILSSELACDGPGGIARYVETFAPLLGATGHEVTVIARARVACDRQMAPNVRLLGFEPRYNLLAEKVESPRPDDHPAWPYNLIGYPQALSFEMADRVLGHLKDLPRPDVIECQDFTALPYYLIQRKLTERTPLERVPILVHLHGPLYELMAANQDPRYRLPEYWTGQMEKFCIRAADALLAPGQFLAERVTAELGLEQSIARIPYPVGREPAGPPHPGTPGELLYVGRLQYLKGVLPLVQSCARLWSTGRDFRLTMVGADTTFTPRSCSMRDYLTKRFRKHIDAGRLHLAGVVERSELLKRMRTSWALIIPSLWENFPLVCIEGMNAGQLVLASRTGGQAEMVHEDGKYGFIFDWDGPNNLESRLRHVLELSPEQRLEIARRGQQRIQSFCDPKDVLNRRIAHYEQIARDYKPRTIFPAAKSPSTDSASKVRLPAPRSSSETADLLSVVIPYYNLGAHLRETLDSIRQSSYRPMEIVIVDDGSTDPESLDVLTAVEAEPSEVPIRVIHTENQGLPSARNNGADVARGEFLSFQDADDTIEPEYYQRSIGVLKRYSNVSFVYPWVRYFGESSNIWPTWNTEFPYLLGHNMASGGFTVMRRQCFLAAGRNKPEVAYALEDFEMWVSVVEHGGVGVSLPQPLVNYRIRKDSMFQTSNEGQQLYLYDVISRLHGQAQAACAVELYNLQQANGSSRLWEHPAQVAVSSGDTLATLRHQCLEYWKELRRMGDAWEQQRAYIEDLTRTRAEEGEQQRACIEELSKVRDYLWSQLRAMAWEGPPAAQDRLAKCRRFLRIPPGSNKIPAIVPIYDPAQVKAELEELISSRAWQLVERVKRNGLYRAVARVRFGPDWDIAPAQESPVQTLSRIKSSRFYRAIRAVKSTRAYSWYTSRRQNGEPDPVSNDQKHG